MMEITAAKIEEAVIYKIYSWVEPCCKCNSKDISYYRIEKYRRGFIKCNTCGQSSKLYKYNNRAIKEWNREQKGGDW